MLSNFTAQTPTTNVVRVPSLQAGCYYMMKTWGKKDVYSPVQFVNCTSGEKVVDNIALKLMQNGDAYNFIALDSKGEQYNFIAYGKDCCLCVGTSADRVTFSALEGATYAEKPASSPAKPTQPRKKLTVSTVADEEEEQLGVAYDEEDDGEGIGVEVHPLSLAPLNAKQIAALAAKRAKHV